MVRRRPANPVSRTSNRVDDFLLIGEINFFTQIVYVNVYQIAVRFRLQAPRLTQKVLAGNSFSGAAHQQKQQIKFLWT
jgi:hypothetical protein